MRLELVLLTVLFSGVGLHYTQTWSTFYEDPYEKQVYFMILVVIFFKIEDRDTIIHFLSPVLTIVNFLLLLLL